MPVLLVAVALLGLAIGSFLNVVIYRVPRSCRCRRPASRCPQCEHPIRYRHNIPVLGWLILRGRCADCAAPISARYPLVELSTAVLFVAVTVRIVQLHLLAALPAFLFLAAHRGGADHDRHRRAPAAERDRAAVLPDPGRWR